MVGQGATFEMDLTVERERVDLCRDAGLSFSSALYVALVRSARVTFGQQNFTLVNIVKTARHFNRSALTDRDQILLPDAEFRPLAPARKEVVVLVIGEAARAANFALYSYDKDTNPFTHDTTLTALPVGLSCSTNTISSTACILTHEGREAGSHSAF